MSVDVVVGGFESLAGYLSIRARAAAAITGLLIACMASAARSPRPHR